MPLREPSTEPVDGEARQAFRCRDHGAFFRVIGPHLEELARAAGREIRYYRHLGDLGRDLEPEELVAETLVRAWRTRARWPERISLRAWLLGTLHRVLEQELQNRRRAREAISTEARVPPEPLYDDDESFWEWYEPDDVTRWEDVIEGDVSPEFALGVIEEEQMHRLEPAARQVLVLHDEHGLHAGEVAYIMRGSVRQTATLLKRARTDLAGGTE